MTTVKKYIANAVAFVRKNGVHVVFVYLATLFTLVSSHAAPLSGSALLSLGATAATTVALNFPAVKALWNKLKS